MFNVLELQAVWILECFQTNFVQFLLIHLFMFWYELFGRKWGILNANGMFSIPNGTPVFPMTLGCEAPLGARLRQLPRLRGPRSRGLVPRSRGACGRNLVTPGPSGVGIHRKKLAQALEADGEQRQSSQGRS